MIDMTKHPIRALALTTALTLPMAAFAQEAATWTYTDWDSDGNLEVSEQEFGTGLSESGVYSAWDRDDTAGLSESELATGMYSSWDTDDDNQITEAEYTAGAERWYGADNVTPFSDYDADQSGYIDTAEFGTAWNNDYYAGWDANDDALLDEAEFNAGVYDSVDANDDYVVTVEEEGWFEGWFDGDDIEAEVEEVGDVF